MGATVDTVGMLMERNEGGREGDGLKKRRRGRVSERVCLRRRQWMMMMGIHAQAFIHENGPQKNNTKVVNKVDTSVAAHARQMKGNVLGTRGSQ